MSQYPYPPQLFQPNYAHLPPAPGAHPTLFRASLFLFVIGGLTALGAFCFSGLVAMSPIDALNEVMAQQQKTMSEPIPFTASTLKTIMVVMFVIVAVIGVIHFALGFGVKKGTTPAIMAALAITGMSLILLLIFVFFSLLTIAINPAAGLINLIMFGFPAVAMVFQFIWLLKARAVAASGTTTQQQQLQMWQHQQIQQAYAQAAYPAPGSANPPGYGYGYGYGAPQQPMSGNAPAPSATPGMTPSPAPAQPPAGGPADDPPRQE